MRIEEQLQEDLRNAVVKAGFPAESPSAVEISESKQKDHGDLATNAAFAIAKQAKTSPRAVFQGTPAPRQIP